MYLLIECSNTTLNILNKIIVSEKLKAEQVISIVHSNA